jgi:hypothetical protein
MRWFYELAWLWKGLGISLLAAAACMVCVWLVWESGDAVYLQGRREMSGRKVKLWERMD